MEPLERCALRPIDPAQLIYGPGEFLNKPATWTQSWTQRSQIIAHSARRTTSGTPGNAPALTPGCRGFESVMGRPLDALEPLRLAAICFFRSVASKPRIWVHE